MKYFGFLARFVVVPLLVLRFILWRDRQRRRDVPEVLQNWPEDAVLKAHVAVAVAYTTPWDNYLVATKVWSYDPDLVTGFTLGWVPIEEYSFFVLQSVLTGSWLQVLSRRWSVDDRPYTSRGAAIRAASTAALGWYWWRTARSMASGRKEATYRDLILVWSLPPIMLQTAVGADILWRHRGLIATTILTSTTYLGLIDSIAIRSGTWAITEAKTFKHEVIPHLPFEELLFFFMTNVLLTFGITLVQAKESENRLPALIKDSYLEFKARWMSQQQA